MNNEISFYNMVIGLYTFSPSITKILDPMLQNFSERAKKIASVGIGAITAATTIYYGPTTPISNFVVAIVINDLVYQLFEPYSEKNDTNFLLRKTSIFPLGIFALTYFYPHNFSAAKIAESFLLLMIGSIFKKILTDYIEENYGKKHSVTMKKLTSIGLTLATAYNLYNQNVRISLPEDILSEDNSEDNLGLRLVRIFSFIICAESFKSGPLFR